MTDVPKTTTGRSVAIHYVPNEIYDHWRPAVNERLEADGVHGDHSRRVYVTVDGDFAGTMDFSTESSVEGRGGFAMCYGQRDQILGVPSASGEAAAAEFIAGYYREGGGYPKGPRR